ncbi:hypothetical protein M409DRAFT_56096 [Zasmidium cellare ATCC 36951]|uniref:Amidohydrolase-related domain-containing protein n=1 Tax=Zasmidium cellare ATCC 36951 TaxID=1080233 RepID=A0A6A6CH00_ZASCE|nr:uncharacterized protein M409DRAFT_56096 [Zasmidium cellare ATCC 36951]KAF2165222.1 hypothetical protein M409DRAFT_56096 [Zasmidium cellare ATCC 36951]
MPTVDIHTHMYPPLLMSLLRARQQIPYVRTFDARIGPRLIILPTEEASTSTAKGRPIGPAYFDISAKIAFMDRHGIDVSVLSLANPWLDWVASGEAAGVARGVNDDMEGMCAGFEGRLFFFGTLPLSASEEAVVGEVQRLKGLKHCRGVVMGTSGLGEGLDDAMLDALWRVLEEEGMVLFLHPHYGLPDEVYGPRKSEYGHVLPLAMGFPLETTIAVTRMLLSGVFDRFPKLQVLLAHSGGTLPFLAGRIESCIAHDAHLMKQAAAGGRRDVWDVLKKNIYLDAVVYSQLGLKAAIEASGKDRLMFGTDHPFFPPLEEEEEGGGEWLSVTSNVKAVRDAMGERKEDVDGILGGNAVRVLRLGV